MAWWGGLGRVKQSQADHIWCGWVSADGSIRGLEHRRVDLMGTEVDTPAGRYRDPTGARLVGALLELAITRSDPVVVALDAPLDAEIRANDVPRRIVNLRGAKTGARLRKCEHDLRNFLCEYRSEWARDVRIQPGAPLFPRVRSIVTALGREGFAFPTSGATESQRTLIEIFPSASIGILGALGGYRELTCAQVRRYKQLRLEISSSRVAHEIALAPLVGFRQYLGEQVSEIADRIAREACRALKWGNGRSKAGKGFDDPIDAGIAFLTAACFCVGTYRRFGDGSDGAIVVPFRLTSQEVDCGTGGVPDGAISLA